RRAGSTAEPRPIRVLDLGSGTGRTIRRIVFGMVDVAPIAYRGIEISAALAQEADHRLRNRFSLSHLLQPLDRSDTEHLVVNGEICEMLLPDSAARWFGDIDCVVASYCLHHIPNN